MESNSQNSITPHLLKGDPLGLQVERDPKKAKAIESDQTEMEAEIVEHVPDPPMTFKDKLFGNAVEKHDVDLNEHGDFDLDDSDVLIDTEGSVPAIHFSEKVQNKLHATLK